MRKKIVAANWKMNMTQAECERVCGHRFCGTLPKSTDVEVVIIPPFTAIAKVSEALGRREQHQGRRAKHVLGEQRRVYRRDQCCPVTRPFRALRRARPQRTSHAVSVRPMKW